MSFETSRRLFNTGGHRDGAWASQKGRFCRRATFRQMCAFIGHTPYTIRSSRASTAVRPPATLSGISNEPCLSSGEDAVAERRRRRYKNTANRITRRRRARTKRARARRAGAVARHCRRRHIVRRERREERRGEMRRGSGEVSRSPSPGSRFPVPPGTEAGWFLNGTDTGTRQARSCNKWCLCQWGKEGGRAGEWVKQEGR